MIKCRIARHECQNVARTYKESELRCGESGSNREITPFENFSLMLLAS